MKRAFYFVEIQCTCCLYLQNGFEFWKKISNQFLTLLIDGLIGRFLHTLAWILKHLYTRNSKLLRNNTIYEFLNMISIENLHWGYHLINGLYRWDYECGHITFPAITFWCATPYLKFEAMQLNLEVINLVKGNCTIYRPEYIFKKVMLPSW